LRPLCTICASARLNSVQCRLHPCGCVPWNSNFQPSDVTCHLVAIRDLQSGSATGLTF
jgi:hypothetical protein